MKIGIVSDTHGQSAYTRDAVRVLSSLEVELVLHCGDIGSPSIVELFQAWPTHFVFGNVDDDHVELRAAIENAGQHCHGRFGSLLFEQTRIALLHGDDTKLLDTTIGSGEWDLVCHGHTHVARKEWRQTTLVLNPGALYRANPHSIAVVELPALEVTHVQV